MRLARADRERHHRAIDGTILAASEYVNVVATSQSHYGVAAARAWSRAGARGCAFHAGSRPLGVMWSGATLLLPAAAMRLGGRLPALSFTDAWLGRSDPSSPRGPGRQRGSLAALWLGTRG